MGGSWRLPIDVLGYGLDIEGQIDPTYTSYPKITFGFRPILLAF